MALFCLLICTSYILPVSAQEQLPVDSLQWLEEVSITDSRLHIFSTGNKVAPVSSHVIGQTDYTNAAEMLMKYSAVNVRSYGVSGLSTASLRGTGSNQTAVFWEGINLQSAMNGSLDLTLVPVSFMDEVALQYGSSGSQFGAGTLGGAIHLSTAGPLENAGWNARLFQQFGSFGHLYTGINGGYRHEKYAVGIRYFRNQATNDFPFYNVYNRRDELRQHAGINQEGVLLESSFQAARDHQLTFKYWFQDNQVQVAEVATVSGNSQATQADRFHRAVFRWEHTGKRYQLKARTALLQHRLLYESQQQTSSSASRAFSSVNEMENTYYLGQESWLYMGVNYTYETAAVSDYGPHDPQRHNTSLFASYRNLFFQKLEATLGLRQMLVGGNISPVLPSIGLDYTLYEQWKLRAKIANSFRIPTFNDLYWTGAGAMGNPNLQPEKGWSTELGIQTKQTLNRQLKVTAEFTGFSNLINQWIAWLPVRDNIWTPVNVEQVWSRGGEISGDLTYQLNEKWSARLWSLYTFTKATKERIDEGGNPNELYTQLIYTPYHQWKTAASLHYHRFTLGYAHQMIGAQYTTGNNDLTLPAYSLGDISLEYQWPIHQQHLLLLNAKADNVFNHQYEVRRGYPMPGRNFHFSIIYQFN